MRFLILLIIPISIFAQQTYFWQMTEKQIDKTISDTYKNETNYFKRIAKYTYLFNKTPYKLNVLGEGKKKPLYSFKGVDCVTYIETVLALANSTNLKSSIDLLQQIRYKNGEINYNKRNHFTVAQWIPNNIKLGLIEDVTSSISKKTKTMIKKITTNSFNNKKFKNFKILGKDLPIGGHKIEYIPIEYFFKNQNKMKFKDGTIMILIRENRSDYPIFTSHLGFIINSKKGKIFRSAVTNSRFKEVRDYNLLSYLRFYTNYYSSSNWKIIGVSLFLPKELNVNK